MAQTEAPDWVRVTEHAGMEHFLEGHLCRCLSTQSPPHHAAGEAVRDGYTANNNGLHIWIDFPAHLLPLVVFQRDPAHPLGVILQHSAHAVLMVSSASDPTRLVLLILGLPSPVVVAGHGGHQTLPGSHRHLYIMLVSFAFHRSPAAVDADGVHAGKVTNIHDYIRAVLQNPLSESIHPPQILSGCYMAVRNYKDFGHGRPLCSTKLVMWKVCPSFPAPAPGYLNPKFRGRLKHTDCHLAECVSVIPWHSTIDPRDYIKGKTRLVVASFFHSIASAYACFVQFELLQCGSPPSKMWNG